MTKNALVEYRAENEPVSGQQDKEDWKPEDEKGVDDKQDWTMESVCYLESLTSS